MFQPSADLNTLKKRARLFQQLRAFFCELNVMEVDVPVMGQSTVTDVYLEPLRVNTGELTWYLQTSPEYFMKRLLVATHESIFYLGKAFRADESGKRHRPEFTMLEWYRCGFDDQALRLELVDLMAQVAPNSPMRQVSYGELFESIFGCCPYAANSEQLKSLALTHTSYAGELSGKSAWLDLLFSHCVEPTLMPLTLVFDFPQEQCALARMGLNDKGVTVAKRFELYWRGVELANGYWELCDPIEQGQRFANDQKQRILQGLPVPNIDPRFMAAMEKGLPECAGVALGVDRLLMCLLEENDIAKVMPFADG